MWTFHAMGTEVSVAAPLLSDDQEQHVASRVAGLFARTERRFSRFRDDSELAALNRADGPQRVSPEMMDLLVAAERHVAATEGRFDPTVGAALRAAGYDRSFAPGQLDRSEPAAIPPPARFTDLRIDEATRSVERPPHVHVDFGGFLKGRTVDRAAVLMPSPAMLDAGGDAAVIGAGIDGAGWIVEIEDPDAENAVLLTLRVADRGVATTAPNRRRWRVGQTLAHHLIDPQTGEPTRSELAQVTVLAPTVERADVIAKAAFLRGARDAVAWLSNLGDVAAVLVEQNRAIHVVGKLEVPDA
jgi:FAD:protein FMN transferase